MRHSISFKKTYLSTQFLEAIHLSNSTTTTGEHSSQTPSHKDTVKLKLWRPSPLRIQFFTDVQSLEHEDSFEANKADFVVKPRVAPWRLLLIGTIYQHTPASSDKYMLFSLFLITTICNEGGCVSECTYKGSLGKRKVGVWGVVSNGMNFCTQDYGGLRW